MTTTEPETITDAWERLTQPLDTAAPVIITPTAHAEWDALLDDLRAKRLTDQKQLDDWMDAAYENTFGPLDDWLDRA